MKQFFDKLCLIISWAWLFRLIDRSSDALSPPGDKLLHLRYQDGCYTYIFGPHPRWALDEIEQILREQGIRRAVIKRMKNGCFQFSSSVPDEIRQRLRNLLIVR